MSLLTFPNSGSSYYFRSRIPTDLIEHFGGLTEFRLSLKCAIKSRAIRTTKKLDQTVLGQKLMPLFLGVMTKDIREPFTDRQTSKRQERVVGIFMELELKGRMEDTTN